MEEMYECLQSSILSYRVSIGINNNIIIISGIYPEENNDLELDSSNMIWTPVCNVMLEPKSLQQLAMKTVHRYRGQLPWKCLPKKLIKLMEYGSKDHTTDAQDSPTETDY